MADPAKAPPGEPSRVMVGRTIAEKFRIESFVGRGAMGAVYRATQLNLKKRVAIKVMHPDKADGTYASRFKREAKAAARMEHPNLLRVIDFGEEPDGLLYIAMEFLEGRDLLRVLREEFPFTTDRVVSILSQALAALAVAHEMGVIHRDLKPENIMLLASKDDEGNPSEIVKVCDFGVAKILQEVEIDGGVGVEPTRTATHTGTLTAYGTLIGTPEYMSPEQARGEPADARSDLYSLGVILFLMLTGRLPFDAKSKIRLVLKHIEEEPPMPSEIDSKVDLRLEAVCLKALEKPREARYQTAREMRADVRAVLEDGGSERGKRLSVGHIRRERRPSSVPPPSMSPTREASSSSMPPAQQKKRAPLLDLAPTTTIQDPTEAAEALAEARKRLASHPPRSNPPPPMPSGPPVTGVASPSAGPGAGASASTGVRVMMAVIIVLLIAIGVVLATK